MTRGRIIGLSAAAAILLVIFGAWFLFFRGNGAQAPATAAPAGQQTAAGQAITMGVSSGLTQTVTTTLPSGQVVVLVPQQCPSCPAPVAPAPTKAPAPAQGKGPVPAQPATPAKGYAPPAQSPPVVAAPPPAAQAAPAFTDKCSAVHDYGLDLKPEVATSGSFIHTEYWWEGQPEREVILPASAASGGRFILTRALRGHVWEYPAICSYEQVRAEVDAHIQRRIRGGANNAGFVDWQTTGLFRAQ